MTVRSSYILSSHYVLRAASLVSGVLANCSIDVRERLLPQVEGEDARDSPVECGIQYPPTPPPSDDADSRPLSPREAPPVPKLSVTTIQLRSVAPRAKRRTSVSRTNVKRRRVPSKLPYLCASASPNFTHDRRKCRETRRTPFDRSRHILQVKQTSCRRCGVGVARGARGQHWKSHDACFHRVCYTRT